MTDTDTDALKEKQKRKEYLMRMENISSAPKMEASAPNWKQSSFWSNPSAVNMRKENNNFHTHTHTKRVCLCERVPFKEKDGRIPHF